MGSLVNEKSGEIVYINDHIRVNAICPGVVHMNLLTSAEWENFPSEYFTTMSKIVESLLILVDGVDKGDGVAERRIDGEED